MSYKITVQKIERIPQIKRGDHTMVGKQYLNAQQYEDLPFGEQRNWKKIVTDDHGTEQYVREVYDYAPNWEGFSDVDVKIYEQTVDNLDMTSLVAVVNQVQGVKS